MPTFASCVVVALVATASSAFAQVAESSHSTTRRDDGGAEVCVALGDAVTVEGELIEIGPDTISILVHGRPREIPLHMVSRIQKEGDPLVDGVLKGALILGAWCAYICAQGHSGEVDRLDAFLGGFVGGALWGLAMDALIQGRTTIFEQPLHRRRSRAAVAISFSF